MRIAIFSHGKESGPKGDKIRILRQVAEQCGYETISIDYTKCKDACERIDLIKDCIDKNKHKQIVLIGSSMGGYVATVAAGESPLIGLFLLCPALYMPIKEYTIQDYLPLTKNIEIVHGWNDEVVPFENSILFGKQTKAVVNFVDDNHRLKKSYSFIENRFKQFLDKIH